MKLLGPLFGVMALTMLSALAAEMWISRRRGLGWYDARDALANLNLTGGRMALGVPGTLLILAGYGWVAQFPLVDLKTALPAWAFWGLGLLLVELLQYWSHRLAHEWHWLGWAHMTHHSSSWMNLTTSMRISWVYRYYIWVAYLPMALIGYGVVEFIALQGLINTYNQFLHTRFDIPLGPLRYLLLSPADHRMHHARDPRWFGNYGAMLSIYDRLFGTYRSLPDDVDEAGLQWGMEGNIDVLDPIALNIGPLVRRGHAPAAAGVPMLAWVLMAVIVVFVLAGVTQRDLLPLPAKIGFALVGTVVALGYGRWLDRTLVNA